jgi:streptomycin 6-kinase
LLNLPEDFRKNILDNFKQAGTEWLAQLPRLIHFYEQRWDIRAGEPFLLSYHYVAPAERADGTPVVLKLGVPGEDFSTAGEALQIFDRRGMARLLEADLTQGAVLLERLLPGRMLVDEIKDDDEATRICARVMQAMWTPAPVGRKFPRVERWVKNFTTVRDKYAGGDCPLTWKTVDRTEKLAAELLASAGQRFLLHGDLHHFNILSVVEAGELGWRAIDPFGIVGEREMEPAAMLRNPYLIPPVDEKMLRRRLAIFQEMLGFDLQRMIAWAAVYCALSAWWTLSVDAEGWELDAQMAEVLYEWL